MTALQSRFDSVEQLLDDARSRLLRVTPLAWQRAEAGEVPGSVIVERNHLEWRLHPESSSRLSLARPAQQWIVLCAEGYTSSLAADALNSLGIPATDVVGGFAAWQAAGLPTVPGVTEVEQIVS